MLLEVRFALSGVGICGSLFDAVIMLTPSPPSVYVSSVRVLLSFRIRGKGKEPGNFHHYTNDDSDKNLKKLFF